MRLSRLVRACALLALSLLLSASVAYAAETHDEGEVSSEQEITAHEEDHEAPFLLRVDPGAAIWNLVIFLGVFGVLSKFAWPSILEGLKAREDKIRGDLSEAERAKSEAQALLSDYQGKLDDARTQVQSMLAEARTDAEQSKAKIVEEAKAEADRQRDRAIAEVETAKSSAVSEMANLSSGIALQLAQQVVGRELKESDHADLIQKSLDGLPSNN